MLTEANGMFSSRLTYADRQRLRAIVRKVHLAHCPSDKLTDLDCDKLIDAWGPEVATTIIRHAVDSGRV
jgi:hypothetical protein